MTRTATATTPPTGGTATKAGTAQRASRTTSNGTTSNGTNGTTTTATPKKTKRPGATKARRARLRAERSSDLVRSMTVEERRAELERIAGEMDKSAPTLESASSDLLRMLQILGSEFIRRYYPDAEYGSLYISKYGRTGPPEYHISLPVPLPVPLPNLNGSNSETYPGEQKPSQGESQ
jgi:hypothetical protein